MKFVAVCLTISVSGCLAWTTAAHADTGHCRYVQQSRVQAHQVCEMPTDEVACTAIGEAEGNSEAEYAPGACPVTNLVGTCDKGASRILYFSGNPAQIEIGCGFQGGTWINP